MTQVLTDDEAKRLAEIRKLNFGPSIDESKEPSINPLDFFSRLASVRHCHRSELLTMLDAVAARARRAIDDCKAAVIDANNAHSRVNELDAINAEYKSANTALRNENRALALQNGDLSGANRALRRDLDGTVAELDRLRKHHESISGRTHVSVEFHRMVVADREGAIDSLRHIVAQLRQENDGLRVELKRFATNGPAPVYIFDMEALCRETVRKVSGIDDIAEKPSFHIKRADAHEYTVEMKEGPSKNVGSLLFEITTIAGIANRTKA